MTIDINQHGSFSATYEDIEISASSLADARAAVDKAIAGASKRKLNLPVVGYLSKTDNLRFADEIGKVVSAVVVGVNRTSRSLQYEGIPKGHNLSSPLPDNPINRKLLEDYAVARKVENGLDAKRQKFIVGENMGYGRIDAEDYERVLKELEDSYCKKAATNG